MEADGSNGTTKAPSDTHQDEEDADNKGKEKVVDTEQELNQSGPQSQEEVASSMGRERSPSVVEELLTDFPAEWAGHFITQFSNGETDYFCFGLFDHLPRMTQRLNRMLNRIRKYFLGICCRKKKTGNNDRHYLPFVATSFLAAIHWALRMAFACLLATIFCLLSPTSDYFGGPRFILPVIAILVTGFNVGRTLATGWHVTSGGICGLLVGIAVSVPLRNTSNVAIGAAIFLTCFGFCVVNKNPMFRKIALLMNMVTILTYLGNPDVAVETILNISVTLFMGTACALVATLVPWPVMASRSFKVAMCTNLFTLATLFDTIVDYYNTPKERDMRRLHYRVKADFLINTMRENIALTKERFKDTIWEKPFMKNEHFEQYVTLLVDMLDALEGMNKSAIAAPMHHTLHPLFVSHIGGPMKSLALAVSRYSQYITKKAENKITAGTRRGTEIAREYWKREVKEGRDLENQISQKQQQQQEEEVEEDEKEEEEEGSSTEHVKERIDVEGRLVDLLKIYEARRKEVFYYERTGEWEWRWKLEDTVPLHSLVFLMRCFVIDMTMFEDFRLDWSWSLWFNSYYAFLFTNTWHKLLDYFLLIFYRAPLNVMLKGFHTKSTLQSIHSTLSSRRTIGAFQIALAVLLASLIVLIPPAQAWFAFGNWAPYTICLIMERSHQGDSWKIALNRLHGTVAGTIVAYFIMIAVKQNPYGIAACLFVWVALAGYVRSNKTYSYAGLVAAFTAPIVVFYNRVDDEELLKLAAVSRIQATCYAMLIVLGISILWPLRAASLLRNTMILGTLRDIRMYINHVFEGLIEEYVPDKQMQQLEEKIRADLVLESRLLTEADEEPQLWRAPFPKDAYSKIVLSESRLLKNLVVMDRATRIATMEGTRIKTVLSPLAEDLRTLQSEMIGNLDELMSRLRTSLQTSHAGRAVYAPLKMVDTVKRCEERFNNVLSEIVREHMMPRWEEKDPALPLSNVDAITSHVLFFSLRDFVAEMGALWQAVCALIQIEHLYYH